MKKKFRNVSTRILLQSLMLCTDGANMPDVRGISKLFSSIATKIMLHGMPYIL